VLIGAGGGLTHLWRRLARAAPAILWPGTGIPVVVGALLVISIGGALGTIRSRIVWTADDTGTFPAAEAVARVLLSEGGDRDRVIATAPSDLPLTYYLAPSAKGRALLSATPDSAQRIWIVVDDAEAQDVNVLLRRAEIMTVDFAQPRAVWRGPQSRIFVIERVRPGCRLAPERCR
jgi:hypothetical protein